MKFNRLLLLLAFVPVIASAQQDYPRDLTLNVRQPTHYIPYPPATVGEPIQAGELVANRFDCARNDGTVVVTEVRPVTVAPGELQPELFVGVIPKPGTYTCFAYVSTLTDESGASPPKDNRFTGKPLPPGLAWIPVARIVKIFT